MLLAVILFFLFQFLKLFLIETHDLKTKKNLTNTFDAIFVGTSTINILEAIYQTKLGKNVLMIDIQNDIGGLEKFRYLV